MKVVSYAKKERESKGREQQKARVITDVFTG